MRDEKYIAAISYSSRHDLPPDAEGAVEMLDLETIKNTHTVALIVEVFGVPIETVAKDVQSHRKEWLENYLEI